MNAQKTLIIILFVIAGALLAVAALYPIPTEEELQQEVVEQIEPVDVVPEPVATKAWKTSKNHFTIDVPEGWIVRQHDTGGLSMIEIIDPENSDVQLIIRLGLSSTLSGTPISFEAWMNEQLVDADRLDFCQDRDIGGEDGTCVIAEFGDESFESYFGVVDPQTYFYISKDVEEYHATPLWQVLDSIDFDPSRADLREAEVIG